MTERQKRQKRAPTLEELDYLAWHLGGENEYPSYAHDQYGRIRSPGYDNEVSWDAIVEGMTEGDDDNEKPDIFGEVVKRADVPWPSDALETYRTLPALSRLSEREKDVFILAHACMMRPGEIAKELRISVNTVKSSLLRAKRKLAQI
jgi:DNA-directed RNA polymerase specialized sigma24 family protein